MNDQQQSTGDIAITPFPGGYLVGRLVSGDTASQSGWGYEYINAERTLWAAEKVACKHANDHKVWKHADGGYNEFNCAEISN